MAIGCRIDQSRDSRAKCPETDSTEPDTIYEHSMISIAPARQWVFCVGMRRSGSTLQTQLTAAVLGRVPVHLVTPQSVEQFIQEHADEPGPIVAKTHQFLPEAAELLRRQEARIVYVYRDIRDVVASISKKYSIPPFSFVHGGLQALLDEHRQWTALSDIYIGRYETMIADIAGEAARLAAYFGVSLANEAAERYAEELSLSRQKTRSAESSTNHSNLAGDGRNMFDRNTLLHPNHIQSGGPGAFLNVLPRNALAALEWQARGWLEEHDYIPETSWWYQLWAHCALHGKSSLHDLKVRCQRMRRSC